MSYILGNGAAIARIGIAQPNSGSEWASESLLRAGLEVRRSSAGGERGSCQIRWVVHELSRSKLWCCMAWIDRQILWIRGLQWEERGEDRR